MRLNGSCAWLTRNDWRRFGEYERTLDGFLARKRMIVMCSYPLLGTGAVEILEVARTHQFAIAKRRGQWEAVEWWPTATAHTPEA